MYYALVFIAGLVIGRAPMVYGYFKTKKENDQLRKDVLVLKEFIQKKNRSRVVHAGLAEEKMRKDTT